ncbi:MAG: MMPL family transporter [Gaiellaceae bacterium]
MFSFLGDLVYRRARLVLVGTGVFFVVAAGLGGPVATVLTSGSNSFDDPATESVKARNLLAHATGANPEFTLTVLVQPKEGASTSAGRSRIEQVAMTLRQDPAVRRVLTAFNTGSKAFVSNDGRESYLVVSLVPLSPKQEKTVAKRLVKRFSGQPDVVLGGPLMANYEAGTVVRNDLARAELFAFPLILLLALFIFRGGVAALMPLFCGAILVTGTFLALRIVNHFVELSIYALNLVTGLGLGLAIDYSLFIVSRYRDELAALGSRQEAIARTLATAGRTVLFSTVTVAAALASLLVFPQPFLYSMGVGGIFVAVMAALTALLALPALLVALGPRVNALAPARWRRSLELKPDERPTGAWYRLSHAVMRRPVTVAGATIALLVLLGLPAVGIKFTGIDSSVLPKSQSARKVEEAIKNNFPVNRTSPIFIAARAPASARSELTGFASGLRSLPGVGQVTPSVNVKDGLWRIDVISKTKALSDQSQSIVKSIRRLDPPFSTYVGGQTALFVDQGHSIGSHLAIGLPILAAATLLILFAMTGSVVLPFKTLVMNAVTLTSTFGILVFIFQDGRLEGFLKYTSQGALEMTQPVLLAAVVFGLSTDYGVFLLTRIKEARDQGASERESVAIGLERTGRIVTAAALLFAIAVGAFATSGVVFIKMLGVGMALAVLIDATIVRAFLVPSLMALLGSRNWWAPAPLRRLHERLGLSEAP